VWVGAEWGERVRAESGWAHHRILEREKRVGDKEILEMAFFLARSLLSLSLSLSLSLVWASIFLMGPDVQFPPRRMYLLTQRAESIKKGKRRREREEKKRKSLVNSIQNERGK
jgi:hypothetical protein